MTASPDPGETDDLDTPDEDPQRVREWQGSLASVLLPLLLVAIVTAAILAYFYAFD